MPAAAGIIGAGTSLLGGILGSSAASKAAAQQAQSQQEAIAQENAAKSQALGTQAGVYNSETGALAPYQGAGKDALASLAAGTATGGVFNSTPTSAQVMEQDPGYQFNLDQGQKALERAEAAAGTINSGGALKAASKFATNYTTNAYQDAYNQFMGTRQSNYNNLLSLAGLGQTANQQFLNASQNYGNESSGIDMSTANQIGNYLTGEGNAKAAGTAGSAKAWTGALGGIAKSATAIPFNTSGYSSGGSGNTGLPSGSGYSGSYLNSNGDLVVTQ